MTQLLISVKNVQEAALVLANDIDLIDLKDPSNGALGALDLTLSAQIVKWVKAQNKPSVTISATVGEQSESLAALLIAIKQRAEIGVDVVKIAVCDFFYQADFINEIQKLTKNNIKIVAVFFADNALDLDLLPKLSQAGFYGAMCDTQQKAQHLLHYQSKKALHLFTHFCHQNQLMCGLAGSLQPQHIVELLETKPKYIGFRSGVCENNRRDANLSQVKLIDAQNMLRNGNKNSINPY